MIRWCHETGRWLPTAIDSLVEWHWLLYSNRPSLPTRYWCSASSPWRRPTLYLIECCQNKSSIKKRGRHSTDRKTKQPKQKGARHGQLNQNKDIPRWERVRPSRSKMDPFCWPADDLNCLGCYSSAASRLAKGWQRARKLFFFFNGYEGNNQRENDSQRGFNEARVCVCGVVIRSK